MVSGAGLECSEGQRNTVVKAVAVIAAALFVNHFYNGGIVQIQKGKTNLKPVNVEGFPLHLVGNTAATAIFTGKADFIMFRHNWQLPKM